MTSQVGSVAEPAPSGKPVETAEEQNARRKAADDAYEKAAAHWVEVSSRQSWDEVISDLEVYKYSGQRITEDPRRTEEYRQKVIGPRLRRRAERRAP